MKALFAAIALSASLVGSSSLAAEYVQSGTMHYAGYPGSWSSADVDMFFEDGGIYRIDLSFSEPVRDPGIVVALFLHREFIDGTGKYQFTRSTYSTDSVERGGTYTTTSLTFRMPRFEPYVSYECEPYPSQCEVVGSWMTHPMSYLYATIEDDVEYIFRYERVGTVVEPATWTLMIAGFGLAGATLRRRERVAP